jgi:PmbA protein
MDRTKSEDLLALVLERVTRLGATEADALVQYSDSTSVRVRSREIEAIERAQSSGLGLRVIVDGKHASASTNNLDERDLDSFATRIFELAKVSATDPLVGLPDPHHFDIAETALDLHDGALDRVDAAVLEGLALEAEETAFSTDPRIQNSEGAEAYVGHGAVCYGNSRNVRRFHKGSRVGLVCAVIAHDEDGSMERDSWWASRRFLTDLPSAKHIGKTAAERAARRLGALVPGTRKTNIILSPEAAATVVRHLAQALNGYSIARNSSFLCGQHGTCIASERFSLVDNPHIPGAPGSRSFDGEGVATGVVPVIQDGTLVRYLLDSYTARKLGFRAAGQAVRALGSPPRAGSFNLHVQPGSLRPDELIQAAGEGIYVTQFMGMGVNLINGDFSKGASGFEIKNGALGQPLKEFTVAGNLATMLQSVAAVADDLDPFRGISSPSLLIENMTIAGAGAP